jgi:hypothetical protein
MTRAIAPAAAVVVLVGLGWWLGGRARQDAVHSWSAGPTVEHLESLAQLVTTRVQVSDVMTATDEGYLGSWLIRGDGLLSVDMRKAEVLELDRAARKARIRLPRPTVLSARVDHGRTKTWDVKHFSWFPWRGDADALRDQAMYHAQRLVEGAVGSKEYLDRAATTAESVVANMYRMVDWRVSIDWSDTQTDRRDPAAEGDAGGAAKSDPPTR